MSNAIFETKAKAIAIGEQNQPEQSTNPSAEKPNESGSTYKALTKNSWKAAVNIDVGYSPMDDLTGAVSTASDSLKKVVDGGILGDPVDPFAMRATSPWGLTISQPTEDEYKEKYQSAETDPATPSIEEVLATLPRPITGIDDPNVTIEINSMLDQAGVMYQDKIDLYDARIQNAQNTLTGGMLSAHDAELTRQFLDDLLVKKDFVVKQMTGLEDYRKAMGE